MSANRSFVLGLLIGAAAGYLGAMFTAPESGDEFRTTVKGRGIELKKRAVEIGGEAQKQAQSMQERTKKRIETSKGRIEEKLAEMNKSRQAGECEAPCCGEDKPCAEADTPTDEQIA